MTHTIREKQKLLARVRRVRGQVEVIERAIEGEAGCAQVMHLIAGIRGSMARLRVEVMEDHVRSHFGGPGGAAAGNAAEQLIAWFGPPSSSSRPMLCPQARSG